MKILHLAGPDPVISTRKILHLAGPDPLTLATDGAVIQHSSLSIPLIIQSELRLANDVVILVIQDDR